MPDVTAIRAYSDCEACRPGLWSQPVNSLSSLAYVGAGAAALAEAGLRPDAARPGIGPLAWGLVGVGVGSVAYHGPGGVAGRWAHDASLIALSGFLALSCGAERRRTPGPARWPAFAGVCAAAATAANPVTSAVAQVVAGGVAVGAEASRPPSGVDAGTREGVARTRRRRAAAAALLVAGIAVQASGRTGGPLCRPESPAQPHAAWHLLSAAALWLVVRPAPAPEGRPAPVVAPGARRALP